MNSGSFSKKQIVNLILIEITALIISFLLGFFLTNQVNRLNSEYQTYFTLSSEVTVSPSELLNKDYLNQVKENHKSLDLADLDVDSLLNNKDISFTLEGDKYKALTKTRYYNDSFISSSQKVINRAQTFIKYTLTDYYGTNNVTFLDNGTTLNNFPVWAGGLIGAGSGLILTTIIIAFLPKKKLDDEFKEDNINIFHTPFHKEYWKKSLKELRSTKSIVTLAMLFGLLLVSKLITLPSGFANMGIGLGYLFLAIIGMIYGPIISIFVGILSDVIGYFITPNAYGFNPLYTIQAMLAALTYALCFYKTKISFAKVLLSRLIVNLILNVAYGSLCMIIVYYSTGKVSSETFFNAYQVYALYYSLPKNLVYLLPQTILLFFIIKSLSPVLSRMNYIDEDVAKNIHFI